MRVLLLALLAAGAATAQPAPEGSPLWIAERLFDPAGFPQLDAYVDPSAVPVDSGGKPTSFAQLVTPGATVSFRALPSDSSQATITARLEEADDGVDLYLHFVRDGEHWTFRRLRSLALPGYYYVFIDVLTLWDEVRELPSAETAFWSGVDEQFDLIASDIMIRDMSGREMVSSLFGEDPSSFDTLLVDLPAMQLSVASDSTLKAFFQTRREAFEQVRSAYGTPPGHRTSSDSGDELAASLLGLSVLYASPDGDSLTVLVGGFLDSEVGYIYAGEGVEPPRSGEGNYIYVEALGGGWYLYKTT